MIRYSIILKDSQINRASLCAKIEMASMCLVKLVWPHATASTSAVYKLALLEFTCSKELPVTRTLLEEEKMYLYQAFNWPTKEIEGFIYVAAL